MFLLKLCISQDGLDNAVVTNKPPIIVTYKQPNSPSGHIFGVDCQEDLAHCVCSGTHTDSSSFSACVLPQLPGQGKQKATLPSIGCHMLPLKVAGIISAYILLAKFKKVESVLLS